MNALFEPARAGFVVLACLLAGCSGATEAGTDGSSGTPCDAERTPSARAPAVPSASGTSEPHAPSSVTSPVSSASGGSTGAALCGPDELCHGISSCSNSCYGPNCCSATCFCGDTSIASSRLVCQLSCSK